VVATVLLINDRITLSNGHVGVFGCANTKKRPLEIPAEAVAHRNVDRLIDRHRAAKIRNASLDVA